MDDLISRQAAIDAIFKVGHEHIMENVLPIGAVLDYSEAIKELEVEVANLYKQIAREKDEPQTEREGE